MLAGFHRGAGDDGVQVVGGADIHRLDVLTGDQVVVIGINGGAGEVLGGCLRALGNDVTHRDDLHIVHGLISGSMHHAENTAAADDADAKLLHSMVPP